MSFLTEDPDTVNTIAVEDIRETLAHIRENVASGECPRHYHDPFSVTFREYEHPDVRSQKNDKWTQQFDHPKD